MHGNETGGTRAARRLPLLTAICALGVTICLLLAAGGAYAASKSSSGAAESSSTAASSSSAVALVEDEDEEAADLEDYADDGDLGAEGGIALGYDLFLSDESVESLGTEVFANLFSVGRSIDLKAAEVGADAFIAGETINISDSRLGSNLFLAANNITVSGTTGEILFAAGNNLDISADMEGANIAGNTVFLKGTYEGDVNVSANTVVIDPYIVVDGNLSVEAESEPSIAATAKIGSYEYTPTDSEEGAGFGVSLFGSNEIGSQAWIEDLVVTFITLLVAAIILLLALRTEVTDATGRLTRRRPVAILVTGLISIIAIPLAVIGLFICMVGWPVATALIACTVCVVVLSLVYTAVAIGRAAFPRMNRWVSSLIFAVLFALLMSLPIVDFVLVVLSVIFALGSAIQGWWVWRRGKDLSDPEADAEFAVPRGEYQDDELRGGAEEAPAPRPLTPSSIPQTTVPSDAAVPSNTTQTWSMPPDKD